MLKQKITNALKESIKRKHKDVVSVIRLILAVIKDKEISLKTSGESEITDEDILVLLKSMIKQSKESIVLYKKGNRADLVKKEKNEIKIIEDFLPKQLNAMEIKDACQSAVVKLAINNINDIGRVMNELKNKFSTQIDMKRAEFYVKDILGDQKD